VVAKGASGAQRGDQGCAQVPAPDRRAERSNSVGDISGYEARGGIEGDNHVAIPINPAHAVAGRD
jgi:hypothetical protein